VFRRGEPLRLQVRVDDRFSPTTWRPRSWSADAAGGRLPAERDGRVWGGRAGRPGRKRLPVDLPELPAGWYRATPDEQPGQTLGTQAVSFIQLPTPDPPAAGRAVRVRRHRAAADGWDDLPQVLPLLSAGRVKLALWGPHGDVLEVDPTRFDNLLDRLKAGGITPTASLLDLPPALARRLGRGRR
jgi:hypothetical protein